MGAGYSAHRDFTETGCHRHRLQAIVILTLEPERLKNRLATTRNHHRRWKGSSPETLKRLVILVFRRRSSLPSSTESA